MKKIPFLVVFLLYQKKKTIREKESFQKHQIRQKNQTSSPQKKFNSTNILFPTRLYPLCHRNGNRLLIPKGEYSTIVIFSILRYNTTSLLSR